MKIGDIVLEARLSDKIPFIERDKRIDLVKEFGGKTSPQNSKDIHTVDIRPKDKPVRIVAQENRFAISLQADNKIMVVKKAKRQLRDIYKVIDYSNVKLARLGVKIVWLEETNFDFQNLVDKFKETFYNLDSNLIKSSTDISVNLTLKDGDSLVNFLMGPVSAQEASGYTSFPVKLNSEANIFVMVDRFTLDNRKASLDYIYQFTDDSAEYSEKIAKQVIKIVVE
jgi:hypothetical protein